MYTYLLSVSLLRIRSITPSPRLTDVLPAALAESWVAPGGPDLWPPDGCFPEPEAHPPDAVAAER